MRSEFGKTGLAKRTLALALLVPMLLGARKFYDDDPLEKMPPPLHVDDAKFRKLNDYYDLFQNLFGHPGERQPKRKRSNPAALIPAQAVNTLGEAPDSSWFTNRISSHPMNVEEIVRGPGNENAPSMDGKWTIVGAKTEGVTPGFRIEDSRGRRYLLKFDPPTNPEMATGADVIGSRFFHALGYNVPENYLVTFDEDMLVIGEGTTVADASGKKRPMSGRDVTMSLMRVPRDDQGRIRGVASLFLPGKILGEFRYHGTRKDDYNDVVPHEHRRDLRGLFVFCAWLNHSDSRAINTLDSLVEENGRKFIKHYLIDFGSMLGSASVVSNTARDGHAYFFEFKPALAQIFSLGIYVPRWARPNYRKFKSIGLLDYRYFEPERWKPNYPSPAFDNRLPDDTFWAAKKVMAFTDEQIRAIVKLAEYSNPEAESWTVKCLTERRNKIGETYFPRVLPLDKFRVDGGRLEFEDLAVKYGLIGSREYKVQWSHFDNEAETHTPISNAASFDLPQPVQSAPAGSCHAAKIQGESEDKTVTVYLRKQAGGFKVVGIDRTW